MAVFFIYRLLYVLPNPLNRITAATDNTRRFGLSNLRYDKNGNITDLTRGGHLKEMPDWDKDDDFGTMDQLDYQYFDGSNRLRSVTDGILKNDTSGKGEFVDGNKDGDDYVYDPNGNMTQDLNKGIKGTTPTEKGIEYNHLNLPTKVSIDDGGANKGTISYIYDATGVKLRKNVLKNENNTPTDYAGNYIYENDKLQFFSQPEGTVSPKDINYYSVGFDYTYNYTDHLGNIRLSYTDANGDGDIATDEIVAENNYYPFGLSHKGYNNNVSPHGNSKAKDWKFGDEEFEEDLGKNTVSYQWRDYDPAIGRFNKIDRFAEKYMSHSTYAFTKNNPIRYREMAGDSIWITSKTVDDQTEFTIHFRGKVLNTSDMDIDMNKYARVLSHKLRKAFTSKNKSFTFSADVQIDALDDASEVGESDHLQVIVDDTEYGEGWFTDTQGVARYNEKISFVQAGTFMNGNKRDIDGMSTTGVHEFGHNFGLKHSWQDGLKDSNSPSNLMNYGDGRNGPFSISQLNLVVGGASSGALNQGSPTQRAPRTTRNWIYHNSTNEQPYDFNVKQGDIIPTIIKND